LENNSSPKWKNSQILISKITCPLSKTHIMRTCKWAASDILRSLYLHPMQEGKTKRACRLQQADSKPLGY